MAHFEIKNDKLEAWSFADFLAGLISAKEDGLYPDVTSAYKVSNNFSVYLVKTCECISTQSFHISTSGLVTFRDLMGACNAFNFISLREMSIVNPKNVSFNLSGGLYYTEEKGEYNANGTGATQIKEAKDKIREESPFNQSENDEDAESSSNLQTDNGEDAVGKHAQADVNWEYVDKLKNMPFQPKAKRLLEEYARKNHKVELDRRKNFNNMVKQLLKDGNLKGRDQ